MYYSTFPIREQARHGDWNFELKAVYTVGVLNFVFDEDADSDEYYHHEVRLMDRETGKLLYDKLTFIYLEMPKFRKREDELETMFDKWMFVLRNLSRLLDRPAASQERVFKRLFEAAEIARFTPEKRMEYEESLKVYRDLTNVIDTAKSKGWEEGMEAGRVEGLKEGLKTGRQAGILEVAANMKKMGMPVEMIVRSMGLGEEEIERME